MVRGTGFEYCPLYSGSKSECIVEIFYDNSQYFTVRCRINQYIKHFESNDWQTNISTDYPRLLFVADNSNLDRRIQKTASFALKSRDIHGLGIYTVSPSELLSATSDQANIWSNVLDLDNPVSI
jgi:hypothetical protein